MMENFEPKMEFIHETLEGDTLKWDKDFTKLPTGEYELSMSTEGNEIPLDINVRRGLDKVLVNYTHDNHEYTHIIHPDGRKYTHVRFLGNEFESAREWEEKGMWRFY